MATVDRSLMRFALFALVALLLPVHFVQATDITVNSGCSLAQAIDAANRNITDTDTGTCPAGSNSETDTIILSRSVTANADFLIIGNLIIDGKGRTINKVGFEASGTQSPNITLKNVTLSGSHMSQGLVHFNPQSAAKLIISNSTLRNASASGSYGAIYVGSSHATVEISDSRILNNTATDAAALHMNAGTVTLSNSTISGNSSSRTTEDSRGGAIHMEANSTSSLTIKNSRILNNKTTGDGGGVSARSTLTIENSVISGNSAFLGGGIYIHNAGTATIKNSTFSNNKGTTKADGGSGYGGGIYAQSDVNISGSAFSGNSSRWGGGLMVFAASTKTVNITNSSFYGNRATAFYGGGIMAYSGTLNLTHVTIANNSAVHSSGGGGIYVQSGMTTNAYNTLIAGNTSPHDTLDDCSGALNSNTGNLIADGSCSPKTSEDPKLYSAIGSPGYLPLLGGSAAIDAADTTTCNTLNPKVDQRGVERPVGEACDIGAYEGTYVPPPPESGGGGSGGPPVETFTHTAEKVQERTGVKLSATFGLRSGVQFQQVSGAQIGNQEVLDLGVIQAIDVWAYVEQGVEVCFPQSGGIVFLDSANSPRTISPVRAYSSASGTCAWLDRPGQVILVEKLPAPAFVAPANGEATEGPAVSLEWCRVRTMDFLKVRSAPRFGDNIMTVLRSGSSLIATARTTNWFNVTVDGKSGWISADYVTSSGNCG